MTQLPKKSERLLGLFPSSAAVEQAEESKGLKEKASNQPLLSSSSTTVITLWYPYSMPLYF